MPPGKQASQSETAAPMAAGARLEAMRRRVRLSRVAVWTVIAAGPIALAVAVASTPTTVAAAPSAKPTALRTATSATDPGGYAQVFIGAWLRSDANDETSAQARLAQSTAPDVELPNPAADAQSAPQLVTAVRNAHRADGARAVTVAAQFTQIANGPCIRATRPPHLGEAGGLPRLPCEPAMSATTPASFRKSRSVPLGPATG
ncbi:hypothetical protein ACIPSA_43105 [Streptomyces sp. NPDC086549]|uniref:hypothetical protein n=1 Tax=Streptomyces sp. NPDC086549 TaxID=3365752 RepID=UPI003808DCE2